jgi:amino acid adenylation domain-containing protein
MTTPFDPFAGQQILGTAPTTEQQREIWAASQLGDDASLAYNESVRLELEGALDEGTFERAFEALLRRHEILCANVSGDGLSLLLMEPPVGRLKKTDWSALSPEDQEKKLAELYQREVDTVFDLTQPALFRAELVKLSPEKFVFVFTAHHIICDGWSLAVIVKDLARLYTDEKLGFGESPPVSLTYSQYARNEAARPASEQAADDEYFLNKMKGELPILDLPLDRPRPARRSFRARREDHSLGAPLIAKLRELAQRERVSLFATLLSGFAMTIARIASQEEIVLGVPFAGQSLTGHPDLVGHAVNMLPIRLPIVGAHPFTNLLKEARNAILDAQEHQATTLGRLLQKLPIPRDPTRPPLFSVTFNLDPGVSKADIAFQGVDATLHTNPRTYENFEIFVNAVETRETVELECQYNADLFDARTIRRFLSAFERALTSAVSEPSELVGRVDILPEGDLEAIARFNQTEHAYPQGITVDQWVQRVVESQPTQTAIVFQGRTLSYGELGERSLILAKHLVANGVGPGKYVGVCLDRSPELIISILAAWRAGAAYVPMDPDYPTDRLRAMVEDSAMTVMLTSQKLKSELNLGVEKSLIVEELLGQGTAPDVELPKGDPENVAYVIFTSGSTGRPKGVMVPHRAVANLLESVRRRPGLSPSDTVLAITTLSFDIAVSEIWLPLVVGAKIVLTTRDVASDGHLLRTLVESENVSFIDATPATYRLLLGAGWRGHGNLKLICTGEAMPADLARELLGCSGELWNGYGPTETTVWSTFWKATNGFSKVLIGRPLDNTQIHILDAERRPVPIGTAGEIYIGGAGVSHGYLGRPDLTDERFVPDPFTPPTYPAGNPRGLMYRTGDLGRYLPSGDIECLGRNDHQVKLRGFRIELGDIEVALAAHPEVAQATVILREDQPGNPALVGYIVTKGSSPQAAELRTHLKSRLPDYMVPALYVELPELPLTPSGKIDRKALPAPHADQKRSEAEFVAPRTPSEELLAKLWAEVLKLGRVSVEDDFFALGGHSLLASQILARLRRDHGIDLSFRKFFEAPTIALLAKAVDQAQSSGGPKREPPRRRNPGDPIPLSISQERQFLLEEMDPAQRITHNLPAAWEFRGPVKLEILQKSLDHLVSRHEPLRATFGGEGGKPLQRVVHQLKLPIGFRDLRGLPEEEKRPAMMREVEEVSHEPFDLEKGPLFRSILFQFEDERFIYFSLRHNIVWDGWSFDIFLSELSEGYAAFAEGREPNLPELPLSYGDYAIWQRKDLESPEMQNRVAWWKKELAGSPPDMDFPKDYRRLTQSTYAGGNAKLTLAKEYSGKLTEVAHRASTTFFMALYASYVALLHRYSGEKELLVGLPVRGRYLPELEHLIGPFTNTIVLRSSVNPDDSFLTHLAKIRDRSLEAFSYEETPLELLSSHLPPVRALFSFQDTRERPKMLGTIPIEQTDVEHPAAANDLMVWAVERHNKIIAIANFNSEIFEKRTIERFLRSLQTLLDSVIANPEAPISSLALCSPEDEATIGAVDGSGSFHPLALLEARAAREPNAVWKSSDDAQTVSELLDQTKRVTANLKARGVGPGSRVLVLASPSTAELVPLVYGAWGAGAVLAALPADTPKSLAERFTAALAPALVIADEESSLGAQEVRSQDLFGEASPAPFVLHGEAWAQLGLDEEGEPTVEVVSADCLGRAASGLVDKLGSESGPATWIELDPLSDAFGVHVTAAALLRGPLALPKAKSEVDSLLDALEAGEIGAALGSSVTLTVAAEEGAKLPGVCLLWGESTEAALTHLAEKTRVLTARAERAQGSDGQGRWLLFVNPYEPRRGDLLGELVRPGSRLRVESTHGQVLPWGVRGQLRFEDAGGRAILSSSARLLEGGIADGQLETRRAWPGTRIALDGLAATIRRVESVTDSFALTEPNGQHGSEVVLYFAGPQSLSPADLRRSLREVLPESLIPRLLTRVDALPKNDAGQIDIAELPSPLKKSKAARVAPRTKSEGLVVKLVEEILGQKNVSIHDNFFELGGHSLLCLRLVADLERETGRRLSPRIFLLSSLAQAAQALDAMGQSEVPAAQSETKPTQTSESEKPKGAAERVLRGFKGLFGGK